MEDGYRAFAQGCFFSLRKFILIIKQMSTIHPLESQEAPVPVALRPPSSVLRLPASNLRLPPAPETLRSLVRSRAPFPQRPFTPTTTLPLFEVRNPNAEFTAPLTLHIDRIRDPHPKFGWWWMPNAWQVRLRKNRTRRSIIQALQRF